MPPGGVFGSMRKMAECHIEPVGAARRGRSGGSCGGLVEHGHRCRVPGGQRLFPMVGPLGGGGTRAGQFLCGEPVHLDAPQEGLAFVDEGSHDRMPQGQQALRGGAQQVASGESVDVDGERGAGASGHPAHHRRGGVLAQYRHGVDDAAPGGGERGQFVQQQGAEPGRRRGLGRRTPAVGLKESQEVERVALARGVQRGGLGGRQVGAGQFGSVACLSGLRPSLTTVPVSSCRVSLAARGSGLWRSRRVTARTTGGVHGMAYEMVQQLQ